MTVTSELKALLVILLFEVVFSLLLIFMYISGSVLSINDTIKIIFDFSYALLFGFLISFIIALIGGAGEILQYHPDTKEPIFDFKRGLNIGFAFLIHFYSLLAVAMFLLLDGLMILFYFARAI